MPEAYRSLPRSVSVGHLLYLGDTLVGYSILELVRVGNTVWPVQLHPASISGTMTSFSRVWPSVLTLHSFAELPAFVEAYFYELVQHWGHLRESVGISPAGWASPLDP